MDLQDDSPTHRAQGRRLGSPGPVHGPAPAADNGVLHTPRRFPTGGCTSNNFFHSTYIFHIVHYILSDIYIYIHIHRGHQGKLELVGWWYIEIRLVPGNGREAEDRWSRVSVPT